MRAIKFYLYLLLIFSTAALFAQEGLYVLEEGGRSLYLYGDQGEENHWELPLEIDQLYATPGGAYLFLVNRGGRILGLNVQTGEMDRDQTLSISPVQWITFSPTGHELIVQNEDKTLHFDHARGLLSNPEEIDITGPGRISFNRRGTRYYQSSDGSLKYRLYQDQSLIKEVSRTGDSEEWIVGPRFRTLWGFDDQGRLQIVDEPRGRVLKSLRQSYLPILQFSDSSVILLQSDGRSLETLDLRRFRNQHTLSLDSIASGFYRGGDLWYLVFPEREKIEIYSKDFSRKIRQIPLDFTPGKSLWLTLHQGEGFACF